MTREAALLFVPIGDNPARLFNMGARERACRLARIAGFVPADAADPSGGAMLASMAYCCSPAWLDVLKDRPGTALMLAGKPVIVNLADSGDAAAARQAIENGTSLDGYKPLPAEDVELQPSAFKKGARPALVPLDPDDPASAEWAIYDAAYGRVGDVVTLHLLRRPIFYLTRLAARIGLPPGIVTLIGAMFCVLAFLLFWHGHYWAGIVFALVFTILEKLGRALAFSTGASPAWDDILAQGIEAVHPPFWWWAWLHGLDAYGRGLEPVYATMVLFVILGGYLGEMTIEFLSIRRFERMEIYLWRPLDSWFRLIGAGPNPNLLILGVALLFSRPDTGLTLVAWWTLVSLIFHAVRFAQMTERRARGERVKSWLIL